MTGVYPFPTGCETFVNCVGPVAVAEGVEFTDAEFVCFDCWVMFAPMPGVRPPQND